MKALETLHKGYRFRSRLEARWAVAFDAMGWAWEYEPEGFETCDHFGAGGGYLPDFRIENVTLEVKPPEVVDRLWALCSENHGCGYWLAGAIVGEPKYQFRPEAEPILKALGFACHSDHPPIVILGAVGSIPVSIRHVGDGDESWLGYFPLLEWLDNRDHSPPSVICGVSDLPPHAVAAARSARFGT